MNYPPITSTTQKLTFGKYKGRSVEVILGIDPAYIISLCTENICFVSDSVLQAASQVAYVDQKIQSFGYSK